MTDKDHQTITIGRYLLHRQIARGGMATIHIARLMGDEGFSRIVAAKRLHPEFAEDPEFVEMFLDEARIASRVNHRNVVPVLDVVKAADEVVLVQEYIHGVPLHWLLRTAHEAASHVPLNVAVSIGCQVLSGLQAAHETCDELGHPLHIVHRDVSPQNVMVATDGTARLLDFGVAKATMAAHITRAGTFKGKLAYSAPEHVRGNAVQQSDVYSLSVVLWELIVGHRLHGSGQAEAELITEIMTGRLPTITQALASEREMMGGYRWNQLLALEPIIQKGLAVRVEDRWKSAAEMEEALAEALPPASAQDVGAWLRALGKDFLEGRDKMIAAEEASWRRAAPPLSTRATSQPGQIGRAGILSGSMIRLQKKSTKIAIGAMFAVLFAFGVAFVMRSSHNTEVDAAAPSAAQPQPVAVQPVVTPPAPPPPVVHDATVAREPAPVAVDEEKPAPVRPRAVAHIIKQAPARIAVQKTAPKKDPTPAPVAAAPAPAKEDCNPPYYFEGRKKIFKPACL
ncbi:MAG: serine/threonine protein kinase [Deltaproteobacteria bacterium]|nr:serine/threonine protein kinase [Deltaproteobacteria bacterium]